MKLEKRLNYSNDLIFIDGMWGSGKSLVSPFISHMDRVEKYRSEDLFEYIAILEESELIDKSAAIWLARTKIDEIQYNNVIGREINLRVTDDSGLKEYVNKFKLIKRLFISNTEEKSKQISKDNIACCIMSHKIMMTPNLVLKAFPNRAHIIHMARNPIFLFENYLNYLSFFDREREFTPSIYYQNKKVPWFANNWKEEYIKLSNHDRAAKSIIYCHEKIESNINAFKNNPKILIINHEQLIQNPNDVLDSISSFLGRSHYPNISKLLKKLSLPRLSITSNSKQSKESKCIEYDISKINSIKDQIQEKCTPEIGKQFLGIVKNHRSLKFLSKDINKCIKEL
tara:strand:- start:4510 stop:5532 length:1023 start_codon:yes stop_codon:yes gene_type:complete